MEPGRQTEAILLGAAQDAGVPQAGCYCANCTQARRDPARRQFAACLGLIDRQAGAAFLIDATPDLREQLDLLHRAAPQCRLQGVLITHAHMGHIAGLLHLGREALNARRLPLYASPAFLAFLEGNAPWRLLVEIGNLEPHPLAAAEPLWLTPSLRLTPLPVPHRAEFSDTLAFQVAGNQRSLLYCPDSDAWQREGFDIRPHLEVDDALLDGTFYNGSELPGRQMSEVPHPLVEKSARFLAGCPARVTFIHLNHTNPLWQPGEPRQRLEAAGFRVGAQGAVYPLD